MRESLKILPLLGLLLVTLGGCSTTPEASRESDADAKRFEPAVRAALIYLYRPDRSGGVATVWVDDRLVGQTVAGTFFRVVVRPGRNRIAIGGSDMGRIEIDTAEEGVYFVEMRVLGEGEGSHMTVFRSVPPETGKQVIVQCCSLLENWRPGQSRLGVFGI